MLDSTCFDLIAKKYKHKQIGAKTKIWRKESGAGTRGVRCAIPCPLCVACRRWRKHFGLQSQPHFSRRRKHLCAQEADTFAGTFSGVPPLQSIGELPTEPCPKGRRLTWSSVRYVHVVKFPQTGHCYCREKLENKDGPGSTHMSATLFSAKHSIDGKRTPIQLYRSSTLCLEQRVWNSTIWWGCRGCDCIKSFLRVARCDAMYAMCLLPPQS